jgi:hypothetical protein
MMTERVAMGGKVFTFDAFGLPTYKYKKDGATDHKSRYVYTLAAGSMFLMLVGVFT